jgi:hypothetical protein
MIARRQQQQKQQNPETIGNQTVASITKLAYFSAASYPGGMLTHDHLCHEGIYILSACNAV